MHRHEESVLTKLQRIGEMSRADESIRFRTLAHLLTVEHLENSFRKLNQRGAPGVDGVTMKQFKENLYGNIFQLNQELREGRYRAVSVKRVYIPKANGKKRPLGIPTVKDRIVQRAVCEILTEIYEPYFVDNSYGFRPGRSCHDALRKLKTEMNKKSTNYVAEADIMSYFDKVNHEWLKKFLEHRISDKGILRLIGKWLKCGFMENGVVVRSEEGTPQGGPISPMLANIYLHYVLDLWFERKFKKGCAGKAELIRYADDFVVCFEKKAEAERFMKELEERFAAFNLKLAVDKTKLIELERWNGGNSGTRGKGNGKDKTLVFLGFTHYMKKWKHITFLVRKISVKSRNKFLKGVKDWLRENRERKMWHQMMMLSKKLKGFYNYFGIIDSEKTMWKIRYHVKWIWYKSLKRRSQRSNLIWREFVVKPWVAALPDYVNVK